MKGHLNVHHRKPRSKGGDNSHKNTVVVSMAKHEAWHTLFQNFDPYQIASLINATWLDDDYKFVVVRRNHEPPHG